MAQLSGMLEICKYYPRSESTILKLIREMDFPAKKITEGIWESDTELIDKWRLEKIQAEQGLKRGGLESKRILENRIKSREDGETKKLQKKVEAAEKKKKADADKKKKADDKKKKSEAKKKADAKKKAAKNSLSSENIQ